MIEKTDKRIINLNLDGLCRSTIERVVSVEISNDDEATVFIRDKDSSVRRKIIPFHPFIILENDSLLNGFNESFEKIHLARSEKNARTLRAIAKFARAKSYDNALKYLKMKTGASPASLASPYRIFNDLTQQCLILENIRLFRNMTFREIRRLQFDIETLTSEGYDFPNPDREDDKIAMICLRDNAGWEKCVSLKECADEKELLEIFVRLISERDPDVIEGYNIFRFDLPFIAERAKRHKVKLTIGRDAGVLKSRASRTSFAERTINYTRFDAFGRHITDVYFLVQLHDISHRDLEDFNLKSVAVHLGVSAQNRTYISHEDIPKFFKEAPSKLESYCMDDVRETGSISEILSPSYFYQTQILPFSYQNCMVRGNGTRIDAMLAADYINSESALPFPEAPRAFEGALTDAFESGVFENVWHCDIRSLYPSIMLSAGKSPRGDSSGTFLKLLRNLRDFRLTAKDFAKTSREREEKEFYDSLQSTFKILINSFYGYLGFAQGTFNDYALAASVTAAGRAILESMTAFLKKSGALVIEIDTDGIYFQPPPDIKSPENMKEKIQKILPDGIEVELDNTYRSMFCYKSKNYALLSNKGDVSITGAALKSRGLEPFQREYMRDFIKMLLQKNYNGIKTLSCEYRRKISNRKFPLAKFAKKETLQESPESYRKKIADGSGRRSAAYELAINSKLEYKQGDQISYYTTGIKKNVPVVENCRLLKDAPTQRDENTICYLAKFDALYKKFSVFLPDKEKNIESETDLFS
jgi:DNA polymerase elongation subunit (family B)